MNSLQAFAAGTAAALAVVATPASAITNDFVPDFAHPYVGLVVFYDADGEFLQRCSGTLISSTKFLTAGHCTVADPPVASARIYFRREFRR